MKDALIFASYIPQGAWAEYYIGYLKVILKYFPPADTDIFVGINPTGSEEEKRWVKRLESLGIPYVFAPEETVVASDVSAFQAALTLFNQSTEGYRNVWFGHTKGITSHREWFPALIEEKFWSKRSEATKALEVEQVGSWGPFVTPIADITTIPPTIVDTGKLDLLVSNLPKTALPIMYVFTHYVIKATIVKEFLKLATESKEANIFNVNIVNELGGDIYFFEREFGTLASRFGYWMDYTAEIAPHYPFIRDDFLTIRKNWIKENF